MGSHGLSLFKSPTIAPTTTPTVSPSNIPTVSPTQNPPSSPTVSAAASPTMTPRSSRVTSPSASPSTPYSHDASRSFSLSHSQKTVQCTTRPNKFMHSTDSLGVRKLVSTLLYSFKTNVVSFNLVPHFLHSE